MKKTLNLITKLVLATAIVTTATAFYSCDSGLNLEEYKESQEEWSPENNPPSGPLPMARPEVESLMGISSVKLMDEENKFLVRAVNENYSRGTGVGEVGVDAFHDTNRYRIPSATVIPGGDYAGRLLVISDARFGSRTDLPAKASTWVRYSDDNGLTWSNIQAVSDFNDTDMSGVQAAMNRMSVSTGDASIGADSKGNVYSISSFVPPMIGNFFGATSTAQGSPYVWIDGEWYLRLRKGEQHNWSGNSFTEKGNFTQYKSESRNGNSADFVYAVSVKGGPIKVLNGNNSDTPTLGANIGYYMDEYYYLYKGTSAGGTQLTSSQVVAKSSSTNPDQWGAAAVNYELNSETQIHQHVFMPMSPFQVWRGGTFLGMTKSSNGGETWDKTIDITYMTNTFYANNKSNANLENYKCRQYICPTRGFEVENGQYAGQVVFALYMTNGKTGKATEQATIIRTKDQGATWTPGTSFAGGNGTTHKGESAVVEAPNGDLILVSRNYREGGYYPTYAYTTNGGNTWTEKGTVWGGAKSEDNPLYSCGNLISAINLRFTKSNLGNPLVAFSTDSGGGGNDAGRNNGKLWIAAVVADGAGGWKFDFTCDLNAGPVGTPYGIPNNWNSKYFHYSSLAETFNGKIFSAYEGAAWSMGNEHGGPVIDYAFFTLNRR